MTMLSLLTPHFHFVTIWLYFSCYAWSLALTSITINFSSTLGTPTSCCHTYTICVCVSNGVHIIHDVWNSDKSLGLPPANYMYLLWYCIVNLSDRYRHLVPSCFFAFQSEVVLDIDVIGCMQLTYCHG